MPSSKPLPDNLDKGRTQLLLRSPFFATLLLMWGITLDENLEHPAAATSDGRILFNPKMGDALGFTPGNYAFILAHELLHVVLDHLRPEVYARYHAVAETSKGKKIPLLNLAQDAVINAILRLDNVGEMPTKLFIRKTSYADHNKPYLRVYEELLNDLPENPGSVDGHIMSGSDASEAQAGPKAAVRRAENALRQKILQDVATAREVARQAGRLSGTLQQVVDELLEVTTPWDEILANRMTALSQSEYSWAKQERRYIHMGLYLPDDAPAPSMGKVVCVTDVSGSVSTEEARCFASHLSAIFESCRPETLVSSYWDTINQHTDTLESMEEYLPKIATSMGGTDMAAALHWVENEHSDADAVILLTDGSTPWPKSFDLPLYVVCTSGLTAPIGETLHYAPV